MTMRNDLETVAAFIDGERVDPADLKRALATEEGREYLVALVALREVVRDDHDAAATSAPPVTAHKLPRGWWLVSAAAVLLAVAGGFALGVRRTPAADAITVSTPAPGTPAPAPTKILKLEKGVNWSESHAAEGGE
jgi:hypothetical protein